MNRYIVGDLSQTFLDYDWKNDIGEFEMKFGVRQKLPGAIRKWLGWYLPQLIGEEDLECLNFDVICQKSYRNILKFIFEFVKTPDPYPNSVVRYPYQKKFGLPDQPKRAREIHRLVMMGDMQKVHGDDDTGYFASIIFGYHGRTFFFNYIPVIGKVADTVIKMSKYGYNGDAYDGSNIDEKDIDIRLEIWMWTYELIEYALD